jgi:hypothetical protein
MSGTAGCGTGGSHNINNGGTTMKMKTQERVERMQDEMNANVRGTLTAIKDMGRERVLYSLSHGNWGTHLGNRMVFIKVANMDEVRLHCTDLSDDELAEYIALLSTVICAGLLDQKGMSIFVVPGTSSFTVMAKATSLAELRNIWLSLRQACSEASPEAPKAGTPGDAPTAIGTVESDNVDTSETGGMRYANKGELKTITIEECRKQIVGALREQSAFICSQAVEQIDLGKVNLSCSEFLKEALDGGKLGTADIDLVRENLASIERSVIVKATQGCLPADESAYAFIVVTCSDGCVGLILNVPSPLSMLHPYYQPIACTCSGKPDGIEHVKDAADLIRSTLDAMKGRKSTGA